MNSHTIEHKLLNGGTPTEIFYPMKDSEISSQIQEIFEDENYGFAKKEDGVYIDLGANVGMASLYFANWAKRIYAIEPNPEIYAALVKNTAILGDKITTHNVAWSNQNARNFMYGAGSGDIPQTFWDRTKRPDVRAITVDCVTPDVFFEQNKIEHVDILKIDVEESEYIIFPDPTFEKIVDKIDVIIGEAHVSTGGGFPEVIPHMLRDYGFETVFPTLKEPNYSKTFTYRHLPTGMVKQYGVGFETIFIAKRP